MKRFFTIVFLCSFIGISRSAGQTLQRLNPPVFENGKELHNPWAGGLNSPQLSEADFNNDGRIDLFVFDKTADVSIPFLNTGSNTISEYTFAPEFAQYFPKMNDWVLLRDYNGDGIADIFTQSSIPGVQGIQVYQGKYINNQIRFDLVKTSEGAFDILYVRQTTGTFAQVFVSPDDYPDINDIDNDGDIDILTFSQSGGQIYFYENLSVQKGYGRDSFKYERTDLCWGDLFETGVAPCVNLSDYPDTCATGFAPSDDNATRTNLHVGSTLLTFDADNDGDKDLMLGDLSFNVLVQCLNGGTVDNAWIVDQDCAFPSYDISVDISSFPASFYQDVTGDGLKDLLAAPNLSVTRGDDYEVLWLYENTASNEFPRFELTQKEFLVEEMIDVGTGSHPVFVDYDADGLMDIVVGSETRYERLSPIEPFLSLYLNTGTNSSPAYILLDDNWLGFNDLVNSTNYALHPVFADLDNDGDQDLLVGEASGALFYGENIAGAGNQMQFGPIQFDYMDIDIGAFSTPALADLNRDGRLDLVIGESRGRLNYFENSGTPENPQFPSSPTNNFLGRVDVRELGFSEGFSAPFFLDHDGAWRLFSGSLSGAIFQYAGIEGNLDAGADFIKMDSLYGTVSEGAKSRLSMADLNGDNVLELLVGNRRGGLSLFVSTFKVDGSLGAQELELGKGIRVYPNPTASQLKVALAEEERGMFRIFDIQGRLVRQNEFSGLSKQIDLGGMESGIYFIEVVGEKGIYRERFILSDQR